MAGSEMPEDFVRFWAQERDRVYRSVALALGDPSLASEAVDEAMTRALERWSKVGRYDRPAGSQPAEATWRIRALVTGL